eukprot:SAG31_NODE_16640_length_701_cov_1.911960_2_plen_89_part_01
MQRNIRRHGQAYLSGTYPLLSVIVSARVAPVDSMEDDALPTLSAEPAGDEDLVPTNMRFVTAGTCEEYENCAPVDTIEICATARYAPF